MANTNLKDEPDNLGGLLGAVLRGALGGIVGAMALALILTAAALMMEDPDGLLFILAMAALLGGALISGIVSVRCDREHGLVAGLIGGGCYVLLMWLISLFFRGGITEAADAMTPLGMAIGYGCCMLTALLGGLIGRGRKPRIGEGKHSPAALARKQLGRR